MRQQACAIQTSPDGVAPRTNDDAEDAITPVITDRRLLSSGMVVVSCVRDVGFFWKVELVVSSGLSFGCTGGVDEDHVDRTEVLAHAPLFSLSP